MMTKSNTFYKIISVLIAMVLWGYVIAYVNPTKEETITSVPVQLLNLENLEARGLAISGEQAYTVDVVVKGKRGDMANIQPEEIIANADLFGFTAGKNYLPVTVTVPDSLTIVEIKPSKILITLEELVSASKSVQINFEGDFKENTEPGEITTKPEAIEISGAKSSVNKVAYIRAVVDATKITKDGAQIQSTVVPVNDVGEAVTDIKLSSEVITVSVKLLDVKEVKLDTEVVGEPAGAYEVTNLNIPTTVKIRGEKSIIKDIESVSSQAIDLTAVKADSSIPVKVILPDGVELSNESKNIAVDIKLKGITSKTFEYGGFEFTVEGLPDKLTLSIDTASVKVMVSGREAVMSNISKNDFAPHINLNGAVVGTTKAKVFVTYEKQVSKVEILPVEVDITLSEVKE